jgi:xylulokinase
MDRRAVEQAAKIREIMGDASMHAITGRRVDAEHVACKILWLRDNSPDTFRATRCFLSIKDYLAYKLTGVLLTDPVHASYSLLFDIRKGEWSGEILDTLSIDRRRLPEVYPCDHTIGKLSRDAALATGLCEGIPVVAGGPDGTVGAVGAGLVDKGTAVNVLGTTNVFLVCTDSPVPDESMRLVTNCHAVPGKWAVGGPTTTTGGCLAWFARELGCVDSEAGSGGTQTAYQLLDEQAECVDPGSEALLFFPSLSGERTPNWNANARGAVIGLSPNHTRAHLVRSILEGSAYLVREVSEIIEGLGIRIPCVQLVGGGARSRLWAQIHADVFGRRFEVPAVKEATSLGMAMLIGCGLGLYSDYLSASRKLVRACSSFEPDPVVSQVYDAQYTIYRETRKRLGPIFDSLAELRRGLPDVDAQRTDM